MPRHRRTNRNVRGFDIANFTHHHDVRVLPQNMAQALGEGEIDLRFHIDLRNARQPIFHRFFNRDDPALNGINAAEKTIKRSGFSAAGWSGQQNDSVRLREEMTNDLRLLLAQIEPLKTEMLFGPAEQTQAD